MFARDQINAAVNHVAQARSWVHAVYLFGSCAAGLDDARSDIDLAVLCERGHDKRYYNERQLELAAEFSRILKTDAIDIIVLNTLKSSELKYAVVQDGILLYERDAQDLSTDFELKARREYFDHMAALRRAGLTRG